MARHNNIQQDVLFFDVNYFLQGSRDSKVIFLFDVLVFANQESAMFPFFVKCSTTVFKRSTKLPTTNRAL